MSTREWRDWTSGEDGLDALGVRHVTLQRGGASAGLLDRLDGGGRFVGVEVERDELGSLAREQLRNRGADARARAGHNGDLPLEIEHHEEDALFHNPPAKSK